MAQEGEPPKSVDKGKGKAIDREPNKAEEVKKDKDGKPVVNGEKEDEIIGGKLPSLMLGGIANSQQLRKSLVRRISS
jgi:hypothetical protein